MTGTVKIHVSRGPDGPWHKAAALAVEELENSTLDPALEGLLITLARNMLLEYRLPAYPQRGGFGTPVPPDEVSRMMLIYARQAARTIWNFHVESQKKQKKAQRSAVEVIWASPQE